MKLRLLLMPLVALAVVGLVACGGGKKNTSSSNSSGGSSSSSSSSGDATLDLDKAFKSMGDLKSFHFDAAMKLNPGSAGSSSSTPTGGSGSDDAAMSALILGFLNDVAMTGSFVAPDKVETSVKVAGQNFGYVGIGSKSWIKFANTWQANDESSSSDLSSLTDLFSDTTSSSSSSSSSSSTGGVLKGGKTSSETINGIKATHYSFDKNAIQAMNKESGGTDSDFKTIDKASMDVWMSNDMNVPVKFAVSMNGKDDAGKKVSFDFQMNIKDINSNISVKPPI